jgi:NAD-dependent DNA ligase
MKNIEIMGGALDVNNVLPKYCPACNSPTEFDGIHLTCTNENCVGRIAKQLSYAVKILEIKGIGEKTIEPFAKDFKNMYELIVWVLGAAGVTNAIEKYGMKWNSRSHELFVQAFFNIKSLTYTQVIQMLGYDNVGEKLSTQLAREHAGLDFDYANLERALVAKLRSQEVSDCIKKVVIVLENLGITIDRPKAKVSSGTIYVCMTGSPSPISKSKEEFISQFNNIEQVSVTDARCNYLIANSLDSMTSKMKNAEKKGVKIITYENFANKFNLS